MRPRVVRQLVAPGSRVADDLGQALDPRADDEERRRGLVRVKNVEDRRRRTGRAVVEGQRDRATGA
jgi:hypothetical protein